MMIEGLVTVDLLFNVAMLAAPNANGTCLPVRRPGIFAMNCALDILPRSPDWISSGPHSHIEIEHNAAFFPNGFD